MTSDVFLFGASSMLGWSLWQARGAADVTGFGNRAPKAWPAGIDRGLHLNDELAVARLFAEERPRLIVHCAGICDVEVCETSPAFARAVNVEGTRILIDRAPADARIVYCSSDHVFGGDAGPYDEDAATAPISVYGRTRVAAEQLVLARPNTMVVRSGLWIGPSATGRIGHLDWLRHRHRRGLPMTVVSDEVRSAVWAADAAQRVWALARSPLTGIRHVTATRAVARPELATYCDQRFAIGATFGVQLRRERRAPHIGNVELATRHADALATPLPSVVALIAFALVACGSRPTAPRAVSIAPIVEPAAPRPPRVRVLDAATARSDPERAAPAHDPALDEVARVAAASAGDGYVVSSEAVRAAIALHLGSGLDPYLLTARGTDDEAAAQLGAALDELRGAASIATVGVAEVTGATGRVIAVVAMPPPIRPVAIDRAGPITRITVPWPWPSPPRAFDVTGAGSLSLAAAVRDQLVVLSIDCTGAVSRTIELDAGDALVASVVNVCAPSPSVAPPAFDIGPPARSLVEIEQRLFELINRDRVAEGRVAIAWDPGAQRMARMHAARMHALDFIGHVAPDGETLADRVAVAGLPAAETFENVGFADGPGRAHLAFMTSPGHRHNLLAERARRGAVGIVASARDPGWFYVTEVFFEPQR